MRNVVDGKVPDSGDVADLILNDGVKHIEVRRSP